ncbi:Re/Si-specific NAD(P)(+) transhydrogenase subunit alpha [soil metagenome]
MVLGLLKEGDPENRVAILPEIIEQFIRLGFKVLVESGAGVNALSPDEDYIKAGAEIRSKVKLVKESDLVVKINPPSDDEIAFLSEGKIFISLLQPYTFPEKIEKFKEQKVTAISLEKIPRTSRAQMMDVLSSQASAAGYKAVIIAAANLSKFFPMFTTAAGSIKPTKVLILGAGVAGLQAIATAKRLGGIVEVFDTRPAVKEEVKSLGAKFIEVEGAADATGAGGYAVEQSEEYKAKQTAMIAEHSVNADLIITTAQIPGKKAPILITNETISKMKPGSVIIDLAASTGGNTEFTKDGETIMQNGVKIIGNSNLPSTMPYDSSKMFGKNLLSLIKLLVKDGKIVLNFDDDIIKASVVTHGGELINM